jgi:hypothetical protein
MKVRNWLVVSLSLVTVACAPNIVDSDDDAGVVTPVDSGVPVVGTPDAGPNPYPAGPYGVSVNRIIENFTFPGFFTVGSGVKVNTLPSTDNFDLQLLRNAKDANGNVFRYLLLDISAGWCPPCNQEAQDLGLNGAKKDLINKWLAKGGLFMTVLVQDYNQSNPGAPNASHIAKWINQHQVQTSTTYDPTQNLIAQGINPSAFPTNLVIDLRTMRIVSAWYGLDTTYQKWEAALNEQ